MVKRKKGIKRQPIAQSPLFRIRRRKDLFRILNIDGRSLPDLTSGALYSIKDIVTPKGKLRHTETPIKELRRVHERLTRLLMQIEPPDYLFCPVKGRSAIDNAAAHRNSKVVWTLDIKEYFPSTPSSKVSWFFSHLLECAPDVSAILAKISTNIGHLPTGSPLSPILAFFSFFEMWETVARISKAAGCISTVYMDDLTVSGATVPGELMWEIKREIHNSGLRYHKEHTFREIPALITGVILRDRKLLLPHRQHRAAFDARTALRTALLETEVEHLERRLRGLAGHRNQIRMASARTARSS